MIRRLAVPLTLLLALAALPAAAQIEITSPGVIVGSYSANCVLKASSSTGLACGLLTDDGSNVTLASGAKLYFGTSATGIYQASNAYVVVYPQVLVGNGSYAHWLGVGKHVQLASAYFGWNSDAGSAAVGTDDLRLYRDAANTLAQRNGTAAQTFNIYNTYTDGSNYERLNIGTNATTAFIYASAAGSGTQRPLDLGANGSVQWRITTGGHWIALTDNAFDIGASGATRPRTGYFGTDVYAGGGIWAAQYIGATSKSQWSIPVNGQMNAVNWTETQNAGIRFSRIVEVVTGTKAPTALENGETYTNTGDTDGSTITLLDDPTAGSFYCVQVDAAQTVTVAPSAGESILQNGTAYTTSCTNGTRGSGACFLAVTGGSGALWAFTNVVGTWPCS